MSSLIIKSSIRDYEVLFSQSIYESLAGDLKPDDVIFIDKNVFNHLQVNIQKFITSRMHFIINATEEQKSYTALVPIIEQLIENRFRRGNRLIAIGGGITQDMTAFIYPKIQKLKDKFF